MHAKNADGPEERLMLIEEVISKVDSDDTDLIISGLYRGLTTLASSIFSSLAALLMLSFFDLTF